MLDHKKQSNIIPICPYISNNDYLNLKMIIWFKTSYPHFHKNNKI